MTSRRLACATTFSRSSAPPRPLIRSSPGVTSSAPSIVRSTSRASSGSISGIPTVRASASAAAEVGTPTTSRSWPDWSSRPIRLMAKTAVLPVPRPTTIPDCTSSTAHSAACCLYAAAEPCAADSGIAERLPTPACLRLGHRAAGLAPVRRPAPVCDLREVLEVFPDVDPVRRQSPLEQIDRVRGDRAEPAYVLERLDGEMESAHTVEHRHVERSRRSALVDEAANVESGLAGSPVDHAVEDPGCSMIGEDDRHRTGEPGFEGLIRDPMRMAIRPHHHSKIHDVHQSHPDARHVLLQQPRSGAGLERGNVAGAAEHDIGLPVPIVAREVPPRG